MLSNHSLLTTLERWVERGWLSHLDRAFVRFLVSQYPATNKIPDRVLWAAALLSRQLATGAVYLDLARLCANPVGLLTLSDNDRLSPADPFVQELSVFNTERLEQWLTELEQSPMVSKTAGNTPMVLHGQRLYLRRYWQYQQLLTSSIQQRLQIDDQPLNETEARIRLLSLFPSATLENSPDWQRIACVIALRSRFCIITGGPGTGKTTTLTKLLALLIQLNQNQKLNILLAAPTGKAAARVSESISNTLSKLDVDDDIKALIPRKACTLHRLLGSRMDSRKFIHNRHHPLVADIVIVDEASMIDLAMMASLLDALPETARLILLGDKDQLASVEPGSVMGDLCDGAEMAAYNQNTLAWINRFSNQPLSQLPSDQGSLINQQTVMLRHSHRFNASSGIGELARAVNRGDDQRVIEILKDTDHYQDLLPIGFIADYGQFRQQPSSEKADQLLKKMVAGLSVDAAFLGGYGHYLQLVQNRPVDGNDDDWAVKVLLAFDGFQVLSALRRGYWGVESLNRRIENELFPQCMGQWYPGRPVMITRNDYNLGLMNGDIGITLMDRTGKLKVAFPDNEAGSSNKIRWVSPMRLPDVETAYAITVHKSQGSEFDHVVLVIPDGQNAVISRELIYTGITRAKKHFTLIEIDTESLIQAIKNSCRNR